LTEDIIKLLKMNTQKEQFDYFMKLTGYEQFFLMENMLNLIEKEVKRDE